MPLQFWVGLGRKGERGRERDFNRSRNKGNIDKKAGYEGALYNVQYTSPCDVFNEKEEQTFRMFEGEDGSEVVGIGA